MDKKKEKEENYRFFFQTSILHFNSILYIFSGIKRNSLVSNVNFLFLSVSIEVNESE